ncbi:MAG: UDP-glucose--hexose-1-phosphate uridylyltransferase [Anaerolineales bacterium]|nr:UDP-glucose--hexose-1-phosphate uridylyltransferase [Anaerolineales bacterium]
MMETLFEKPHRRLNLLTGEHVLVSPHRTKRPWLGMVDAAPAAGRPPYDPGCYLCPGNERAGGARNPAYTETFVFDNDYAALLPGAGPETFERGRLLRAETERGLCRVLCYSPRHDLTLGNMESAALRKVVDAWTDQYAELGALPFIRHVQIFENNGAMMGASNPHPHGQIWAEEQIPNEPAKETDRQLRHWQSEKSCLLCEYLDVEDSQQERIVCRNDSFTVLVPFWAVWPYETMLLSRAHRGALPDFTEKERDDLADILPRLIRAYDRIFDAPFPYSMGFHQRPTDGGQHPEWHFHAHFFPPLLRSTTIRKFMVGYELLAQPQRDITPESAAERLKYLVK